MRLSSLLGKTLRQPPSEARLVSHQLLVRAGYVRGLEMGQFAYLPLGCRALHRLKVLVRSELSELGAQEIELPHSPDAERSETLVRIVGREVDSYKQLPVLLYQFVSQSSLQPRGPAGLFGAGESPAIEMHAFDGAGMAAAGQQLDSALTALLEACSLPIVWAEAGDKGRQVLFSHPSGDEDMVRCLGCGYAAERSWATVSWPDPPGGDELPPKRSRRLTAIPSPLWLNSWASLPRRH